MLRDGIPFGELLEGDAGRAKVAGRGDDGVVEEISSAGRLYTKSAREEDVQGEG
jgi:hypothetical protein